MFRRRAEVSNRRDRTVRTARTRSIDLPKASTCSSPPRLGDDDIDSTTGEETEFTAPVVRRSSETRDPPMATVKETPASTSTVTTAQPSTTSMTATVPTLATAAAQTPAQETAPMPPSQPRIPEALQQIFLAAARGEEITAPPKDKSGWKIFGRRDRATNTYTRSSTDNAGRHNPRSFLHVPIVSKLVSKSKNKRKSKKRLPPTDNLPPRVPMKSAAAAVPTTVPVVQPRKSALKKSTAAPPTVPLPAKSALKKTTAAESTMSIHDRIRRRNPQEYLNDLLKDRGYSVTTFHGLTCAYHCEPTELQQASYGSKVMQATRDENIRLLKELFDAGLSPNPCNVFGESLIHMVCRRGSHRVLKFMLDYSSTVKTTDEFGRTPLHEACWTITPNFQLVRLILDADINLLRVTDGRKATPLSYVAKKSWQLWIDFIDSVKDRYWPPRDVARDGEEPMPVMATMPPGSVPPPPPRIDRAVDVAGKIASGALDVRDAWIAQGYYEDDGTLSSSDVEEDETINTGLHGDIESDSYSESDYESDSDYTDSVLDDSILDDDDDEDMPATLRRFDHNKLKFSRKDRKSSRGGRMVAGRSACSNNFSVIVDRTPSQRSFAMMVD